MSPRPSTCDRRGTATSAQGVVTLTVVGGSVLGCDRLGTVERLAPDGAGPVLDATEERSVLLGAALAAERLAGRGHEVTLVTPVGRDPAGTRLRSLLDRARVRVVGIPLRVPTPERLRLVAGSRPLLAIDRAPRPGVDGLGIVPAIAADAVAGSDAVLVVDDGDGTSNHPTIRDALRASGPRRPLVWLVHAPAEQAPPRGAVVVVLDERVLTTLRPVAPDDPTGELVSLATRAESLRARWGVSSLVLRLTDGGGLLVDGSASPTLFNGPGGVAPPTEDVHLGVAATVAATLGDGRSLVDAIAEASSESSPASATPAASEPRQRTAPRGSSPLADDGLEAALAVARSVRARGGTVVATGGCFDLLHAGHLSSLAAARALGDCLIVCLNADVSVRRLKGEGRPVIPEDERAATLRSLRTVDAVVIFDGPTPAAPLRRLEPDLFVKGADHRGPLPENELLASWGGRTVLVPYRAGHSTSRLVGELRRAH